MMWQEQCAGWATRWTAERACGGNGQDMLQFNEHSPVRYVKLIIICHRFFLGTKYNKAIWNSWDWGTLTGLLCFLHLGLHRLLRNNAGTLNHHWSDWNWEPWVPWVLMPWDVFFFLAVWKVKSAIFPVSFCAILVKSHAFPMRSHLFMLSFDTLLYSFAWGTLRTCICLPMAWLDAQLMPWSGPKVAVEWI